MNPKVAHRSTRARPAKKPLSEDAIVSAALAILKSEGLEAVTMRQVAAALDTGPASLYVYVSGRDRLLQAMLDRVTATIVLESPDPAQWRAQLHSLLMRMRHALRDHPGIAATTLADPPPTEAVLRFTENMLGILLAAGIDPQDATWACDALVLLAIATTIEDDERRARVRRDVRDRREDIDDLYRVFSGLPPDRFPLLIAHAGPMVAGTGDERFRFAIDVLIDGLVARTARQ